jgi:hypothetical protein
MEKETLEYLSEIQNEAILSGVRPGIKYERIGFNAVEVPAQARNLTVYSVKSLLEGLANPLETQPDIVWWKRILVGKKYILGIAQGKLIDENVEFRLEIPKHPAFELLENHRVTREYSQKDFIRLLRANFSKFVFPSVIQTFRRLKLSGSNEKEMIVDNALSGLSASVRQKLEAEGKTMPESFIVNLPVFSVQEFYFFSARVEVLIETIFKDGVPFFELTAVHDDLEQGFNAASDKIVDRIHNELAETDLGKLPVLRAAL